MLRGLLCIFILVTACALHAGEDAAPALTGPAGELGEAAYARAETLFDAGDVRGALKVFLQLLRKGKVEAAGENYRESARDFLTAHGLTAQELFKLDPDALAAEDFGTLAERVATARARRRKQELELAYGRELAAAAVDAGFDEKGGVAVTVREKDLAAALAMLFNVALGEGAGEHVTGAQGELEALGVIGAQVEPARKAAAEGRLPEEVKTNAVAVVLCRRLQDYRETLEAEPNPEDAGDTERRKVARELGEKFLRYLSRQHAGSPAFESARETLDWWRMQTGQGAAPAAVEKF